MAQTPGPALCAVENLDYSSVVGMPYAWNGVTMYFISFSWYYFTGNGTMDEEKGAGYLLFGACSYNSHFWLDCYHQDETGIPS